MPAGRSNPVSTRTGFTLVEILLVLGLIVVLAAMVTTGAGVARGLSRATNCRANLRQLHLAAETYHVTSDAYPAAILYLAEPGGVRTVSWDFDHRADGSIEPGPIWSYLDGPERVFQCPEFHGASTFGDDPATGYNYNTTYIGAEGRYPIPTSTGMLQGGVMLPFKAGPHTVQLQWRKWGTYNRTWTSDRKFLDGMVNGRCLAAIGERYPMQSAQPLTPVPVLQADGWVAVKDAVLTFELGSTSQVAISYGLPVGQHGNPTFDAWTYERWNAIGARVLVDGKPYAAAGS